MKIKVKATGESFPDNMRGIIFELEVTGGNFTEDSSGYAQGCWPIDSSMYSVEMVKEPESEVPEIKGLPELKGFSSIFGQELSSLNVEFK
mgnify:CR=1 FL=1